MAPNTTSTKNVKTHARFTIGTKTNVFANILIALTVLSLSLIIGIFIVAVCIRKKTRDGTARSTQTTPIISPSPTDLTTQTDGGPIEGYYFVNSASSEHEISSSVDI